MVDYLGSVAAAALGVSRRFIGIMQLNKSLFYQGMVSLPVPDIVEEERCSSHGRSPNF
jgi:hypothetical protein